MSPTLVGAAAALVAAFVYGAIAANYSDAYTSDGTAQQVILHLWRHGMRQGVVTGPDTYLAKLPLYWLLSWTPLSPIAQLRAASLVLAALSGLFVFLALRLLVPPGALARATAVAATVIAVCGRPFFWQWANPNVRNLELAVSFFVVAWLARLLTKAEPSGVLLLVSLVAGLLAVDDPYFLYVFLVPAALAMLPGIVTRDRSQRLRHAFGLAAIAVSGAWFVVLTFVVRHLLNVRTFGSDAGLTTAARVPGRLVSYVMSAQAMLAIGTSGHSVLSPAGVLAVLRLVIVFVGLAFCLYQLMRWPRLGFAERALFLVAPAVSVAFIASSLDAAPRYLVVLPLCAAMYLALLSALLPRRWPVAVVAAVAACSVLGVGVTAQALAADSRRDWNASNAQIVSTVSRLDLTKGYASYWNTNINTFLSRYRITFVPVACNGDTLRFRDWLIDRSVLAQPAGESFYLWQDGECSASALRAQLGRPLMELRAADGFHLAVYRRDIARFFPRAPAH